ncbi:MAG: hypothetical protein EZS28_002203 [Streblomastix strix]|uniref:Uncharacterized protein n=1 Tax=Streblomastix strix TaxID=222440 RepID=A0A5J4X608_9EUKA|nr:MAG: hypothetical protein EZS28_002203 [Streblomastix strix]
MQSNQKVNGIAGAIISFTESNTKNKQEKHIEQSESESTLSLDQVASSLEDLLRIIRNKKSCKQVIRIPKLLQSLIALVTFRLGTHLREQTDLLRLQVRRQSRECLYCIRLYGDEQDQSELVNVGFGRVMIITFCTAGGVGEEKDAEIENGLCHISDLLRQLHEGRTWLTSFQPLPLLARVSLEQIEEEAAIEEIEAQMNNKGDYDNGFIKTEANYTKAATLNRFINQD